MLKNIDRKIILISIVIILLFVAGIVYAASEFIGNLQPKPLSPTAVTSSGALGSTNSATFIFAVNVESFFRDNANFDKNVDIKGKLTAPNLFQSVVAGNGIAVSGPEVNPTITNTGVLSIQGETGAVNFTGTGVNIVGTTITNTGVTSLQGQSGDVTLSNGSGITISGTTISNNGVLSLQGQTGSLNLLGGTGIGISGMTITNLDPGSAQNIFKNISVGNTSFSASGNTDTLTFASGSGITITSDTTNKSLTFTSTGGVSAAPSKWTQSDALGVLHPNNPTLDLLIGGTTTTSAKFGFLNVAGGTPTASVSATGTGTGLALGGDGNIQALRNNSLILGGNTTGNIVINDNAVFNGNLTLNSDTIADFSGDGLAVAANVLNLDLLSSSDSAGLTSSRAGLEFRQGTGSKNQLTLLQGCTNGQILKWDEPTGAWNCGSDIGGVSSAVITIQEGSDTPLTNIDTLRFDKNQFDISQQSTTGVVALDSSLGLWRHANGTYFPALSTVDLLIGGSATASAKFAVLNVNSGTPTASVSAGTTGGAFLTAAGGLQTTAKQSLTLGGGNTGNIVLSGFGTGLVHSDTSGVLSSSALNLAGGSSEITGILPLASGGTNKNITAENGALVYSDADSFELLSPSTAGYILQTNGAGAAPSWVAAGGNLNFWQRALGALSPFNITDDLLLGAAATSAAKFSVLNMAGGTPTASVSATSTGAGVSLAGDSVIQSLRNNTLTIGGNTTGNITLSPLNGAGTVLSTGNLNLASGKTYQIAGTDVLSGTNLGTGVLTSSLTTVGALNSGSITSGFGSIDTGADNITTTGTITGGTLNASSGTIQTGGTNRIDNSGNLVGIGTTQFNGLTYTWPGSQSTNYVLQTNGSGTLSWVDATAISGVNFWRQTSGALFPANSTVDLLIGATATSSAKFAFINVAGGTPTASISANSGNNAVYLTGTGNLATANMQTLTLGGTSTGDIVLDSATGAIRLADLTTNGVVYTSGGNGRLNSEATLDETRGGTGLDTSGVTNGQLLIGNDATNGFTLANLTAGSGISIGNTAGAITISQTGEGASKWIQSDALGTLTPNISTLDLLLGGASSSSAKFAVLNMAGGTPTASVSAGAAGGSYLTSTGTLQTTANQTLALGGNTTGNISLSPLNGSGALALNLSTLTINGSTGSTTASPTCVSVTNGIVTGTGACGAGSGGSVWTLNTTDGTLYPINNTVDLLVGGATSASAKFAVLNVAGGTPTASVSAGSAGSAFLTATGNLQTSARQSLTLGGGNTGNIVLSGAGTGIIHSNASGVLTSSAVNLAGADVTGILPLANGGTNSNLTPVSGAIAYSDATSLQLLAPSTVGYILQTNGAGVAPSWVNAGGTINFWQRALGALAPYNITDDLLVGGTSTASAKFAFINVAAGTPTASISGNIVLDSAGSVQTTKNQLLTIGGNTTGNIILSPLNGSGIVTSTGTFNLATGKTYQIAGIDVLSGNTLGAGVTASSLTSVGTLISGTWNANAIGAQYGGTGDNTSATTGVPYITAGDWLYETQLSSSRGGTGANLSSSAQGAIPYFSSTGVMSALAPGSSGFVLTTNGAAANPSWTDPSTLGTNYWDRSNGVLSPKIAGVHDLLLGNSATASAKFAFINVNSGTPTASVSASSGNNSLYLDGLGNIATTNKQTLTIGSSSTGNIVFNGFGTGLVHSNSSGVLTSSAVNLATGDVTGILPLANGGTGLNITGSSITDGQLLIGNNSTDGFSLAALTAGTGISIGNAGGTITISQTGGGSSKWTQSDANGVLYPNISTLDLLIGGSATASAKFAVLNVNSGTPTASVSATSTGAGVSLAGDSVIQSLRNNTLTIGGNTTGNITLSPLNGAGTVLSTGNLNLASGKTYQIAGTDVLSGTNLGTGVLTSSLTTVGALNSGSITSGFGSIDTGADNITTTGTITGGTLNASSGTIQTGGTNRIDNSGNLVGIGTTQFNGLTYTWPGSQSTNYVLQTNGSGTLSWVDATAISGVNFWDRANGALSPKIAGVHDLLLGSNATASAKFGVLNINSGTPTASVSANSGNNALYLDGLGNIATTNKQTLTIGSSSTGNIVLNGFGTGLVHSDASGVLSSSALNLAGGSSEVTGILPLASGGTGLNITGTSITDGQLLIGNNSSDGFSLAALAAGSGINIANGSGTITISQTGGGSSKWTQSDALGTLTPNISTLDLLVGSTATTSAKFGFLNVAGGTPTASISANSGNNAAYLSGSGNLATTNMQTLTLGGPTTGNLSFNSAGTTAMTILPNGYVGIGTTAPVRKLDLFDPTLAVARLVRGANSGYASNDYVPTGALSSSNVSWGTGLYPNSNNYGIWSYNGSTENRLLDITNTGNVGIGTTTPTALLDVSGTASISGALKLYGTPTIQSTANQTLTLGGDTTGNIALADLALFNAGATIVSGQNLTLAGITGNNAALYATSGTGVAAGATTDTQNLCLVSGASAPSWQSCALGAGTNFWNSTNGALYPGNSTLDLLVGGTATTSAKFAVLNIAGGTPTASVSAGTAGGAYLNATGTLSTTANQTLSLGASDTGNIQLAPNGSTAMTLLGNGNVGIGNTEPAYKLDVGTAITLSTGLTSAIARFGSNTNSTSGIQMSNSSSGVGADFRFIIKDTTNHYFAFSQPGTGNTGTLFGLTRSAGDFIFNNGGTGRTLAIGTVANNSLIFGTNDTERMRVSFNGNVGIGTTSPLATLDVRGNSATTPAASISANSNFAALLVDNTGSGDLFTASKSGATKFVVKNNGDIGLGANQVIDTLSSGTLDIGTTNATTLTLGRSGQGITLPGFTGQNGVLYGTQTTGVLAQATTASQNLCLVSGASAPTWQSCALGAGTNFWNSTNGALYPGNSTLDLLVGGTASNSAKFGFLNVAGGTPTASISASSGNNATYLTGDGTLATTNRGTLTIGNSSTYDSTGNVLINPNGTGSVAIGTTNPVAKLDINGSVFIEGINKLSFASNADEYIQSPVAGYLDFNSRGRMRFFADTNNNGGPATDNIEFYTGPTAKMVIQNNGRVGINTTSPLATLDVRGNSATTPAASISANSNFAALLVDNTGSGDLFTASKSGATKFVVKNNGDIGLGANQVIDTLSSGTLDIGTTNATTLTLGRSGQGITLPGFTGQNGVLYGTQTTGVLAQATTASQNLCLVSGASAPSWQSCALGAGTNFWNSSNGALYPGNSTLDLLIGGTTSSSAVFKVSPSGTSPTASISANTSYAGLVVDNKGLGDIFTASSSGLNRFVIKQNGNVGIGVDIPTAALQVGNEADTGTVTPRYIAVRDYTGNAGFSNGYAAYTGNWANSGIWGLGAATNSALDNTLRIGNVNAETSSFSTTQNLRLILGGTLGQSAQGALDLRSNLGTLPAASISAQSSFAALVVDNKGVGDLFTASKSGATKFVITNAGDLRLAAAQNIDTLTSGTLSIGTTNATTLTLGRSGQGITLPGFTGQNGVLYGTQTTGVLAQATTASQNLCLVSGASAPTWQSCALGAGTNFWNSSNGALYPGNSTLDLLIGGTTSSSAVFKVSPSGTSPTASISANTSYAGLVVDNKGLGDIFTASSSGLNRFVIAQNGNVGIGTTLPSAALQIGTSTSVANPKYLTIENVSTSANGSALINGNWESTNRWGIGPGTNSTTDNTLRIGNSTGGDWSSTQNLRLILGGTNGTSAQATLDIRSNLGTLPAASVSAQSSFAALVVDNKGLGDLFTASSSGLNRFVIKQNGNVGIGTTTPDHLLHIAGASTTLGDLLKITYGGSDIFKVNETQITSNVPHQFLAAGDVSMAYDLQFTNQTASFIKSYGPLAIESGEIFESSDLTLRTFNQGNLNLDLGRSNQITIASPSALTFVNNASAFGSALVAGAFIQNNSYFGEEFDDDVLETPVTADNAAVGDNQTWYADTTSALWTISQGINRVNGTLRAVSTNTAVAAIHFAHGQTQNVQAKPFLKANLPTAQIKFMTNNMSATNTDYYIGMTDTATGTATDNTLPANGIYFTNNNTASWVGQIRSGSATVGTTAACGTISTTAFAVMRIEVLSATTVRFLLDPDVSDGVSFTDCGTLTGAGPTAALGATATVIQVTTTQDPTVDLDYFRVWQDDAPKGSSQIASATSQGSYSAPADINSFYQNVESDELEPGTVVSIAGGTSTAVQKSTGAYDTKIIGVVSDHGSDERTLGQQGSASSVLVSHTGRAPVKISTENGAIQQGDSLTASSIPGVAMKATRPGSTIGKALESYNGQGTGKISVFLNTSFADPNNTFANLKLDSNGNLVSSNNTAADTNTNQVTVASPAATQSSQLDSNSIDLLTTRIATAETNISTTNQNLQVLSSNANNLEALIAQTASSAAFLNDLLKSPLLSTITASQSATLQLSLENLDVNLATVSGDLNVLGRTTLSDLSVTGQISNGLLSINGLDDDGFATINTSAGTLKLQSHGLYGLDILDGKIIIAANGNIKTEGEITAKKVNIDTSDVLSASIGEATIPIGSTSAVIETTAVNTKSKIFLTPKTKISLPLSVTAQTGKESFKVEISAPTAQNIKFNWWIIN